MSPLLARTIRRLGAAYARDHDQESLSVMCDCLAQAGHHEITERLLPLATNPKAAPGPLERATRIRRALASVFARKHPFTIEVLRAGEAAPLGSVNLRRADFWRTARLFHIIGHCRLVEGDAYPWEAIQRLMSRRVPWEAIQRNDYFSRLTFRWSKEGPCFEATNSRNRIIYRGYPGSLTLSGWRGLLIGRAVE